MLESSSRIWLKDGSFVQFTAKDKAEDVFADMLEEKLGIEAKLAFRDLVAVAKDEAEAHFYDEGDYL